MTKIIQLITPHERFTAFDKVADKALSLLDELGERYVDLGFREVDVEHLTKKEADEFKDELKQHSQLILSLLHHPILQILDEKRNTALVKNAVAEELGYPEGVWQHYKGAKYKILGKCRLTDSRLDGVTYQLDGQPESKIYAISLINFHCLVTRGHTRVKRFVKVA